jgi:serine/threonine protein phosphatase PrpC
MGFEVVTRTHVGRKRTMNEDAVLSRPDLGLWAVADGMGGHDAGEVASALVVETLQSAAPGLGPEIQAPVLKTLLADANARLVAMAEAKGGGRTMGATVVALAADNEGYACLWAGDCRAYLARSGALHQLTRDHSLVQRLVDMGELTPAEARGHPNGNVVTRAVGADPALEVDAVAGEVAPGDAFLLASDGVTRVAEDEELLAAMQAADLDAAAEVLVDLCLDRGAPDNLSFVIVRRQ